MFSIDILYSILFFYRCVQVETISRIDIWCHAEDILVVAYVQRGLGVYGVKCPDPSCPALYWEAERPCGSLTEVPAWCCGKTVKVRMRELAQFRPIENPQVHELFFGETETSEHFHRHIQAYNAILSVAMPVVKFRKVFRHRRGQEQQILSSGLF